MTTNNSTSNSTNSFNRFNKFKKKSKSTLCSECGSTLEEDEISLGICASCEEKSIIAEITYDIRSPRSEIKTYE